MKHAIVGAGGIGGLMGAALAHPGNQVAMVVRPGTLERYPQRIHLDSTFGTFEESVEWTESMPEADVVWLTVKALQFEDAVRVIAQAPRPKAVVPLLNGVDHVTVLRKRFSDDIVVAGTIAVESERIAPGRILHRSPFAKLNLSSRGKPLLETTMNQLHVIGFTGEFIDNEATLLWGKLVFLGPIALSTTSSNMTIGDIVSDAARWSDLQSCVQEACTVGKAEGAKLNLDVVLNAIRALPVGMRSSMQKDVEQGRAPELDAIGGAIVRAAHRHTIDVPVTQRLIDAVEERVSRSARA